MTRTYWKSSVVIEETELLDKLDEAEDWQFIETNRYDVRDLTIKFESEYLLKALSDKLTEISMYVGDIPPHHYVSVNELKYDQDDRMWYVEATIQKEGLQ